MEPRTLTITLRADWQAALRDTAASAFRQTSYVGETLNFDSPAAFFGQLTEKRWSLVRALQEAGNLSVRELARRSGRDVKRVHEDAQVLVALGLFKKSPDGSLSCPYGDIHVDMHLQRVA